MTAQGLRTTADVVVADISDGDSRGRAEGVPVGRFGESIESVFAAVEAMKGAVLGGLNRETLQTALPPGAARNALDCALWDADDALLRLARPIPICADESCRTCADLDRLAGKYDVLNIKLDKAGGLTEALALAAEAKRRGFRIMAGGMVGTSLGVAPALVLAQQAEIIDLDGPMLLASDRVPGLRYDVGTIHPPEASFWG